MPYDFAYNGLFVLFDRAPFLQFHSVSGRLGTFSFPQAVVLFGCGVLGRLFLYITLCMDTCQVVQLL